MPLPKNGKRLFLVLAILSALSGCRKDPPPAISLVCLGDGYGGADCVTATGEQVYKAPSELLNFWMSTQVDMQNYMSWCYKAGPKAVAREMASLAAKVHE